MKPEGFLRQVFYDSKADSYSASRIVMVASFFLTACISFVVLYIVYDSYFHAKEIPDLSWLMYGGTSSGGLGLGSYAMNRWGTRNDSYTNEEPYSPPIQVSEDENETE